MREDSTPVAEQVLYALLILAEIYVILDQNDRMHGGPGLRSRLETVTRHYERRFVKPWHYPKRWVKMVTEVLLEAWNVVDNSEGGQDESDR